MLTVLDRLTGRAPNHRYVTWQLNGWSWRLLRPSSVLILLSLSSKAAYSRLFPNYSCISLSSSFTPHRTLLLSLVSSGAPYQSHLSPAPLSTASKARPRITQVFFPTNIYFDRHYTWSLWARKLKPSSTATILRTMKSFSMSHIIRLVNMCVGIVVVSRGNRLGSTKPFPSNSSSLLASRWCCGIISRQCTFFVNGLPLEEPRVTPLVGTLQSSLRTSSYLIYQIRGNYVCVASPGSVVPYNSRIYFCMEYPLIYPTWTNFYMIQNRYISPVGFIVRFAYYLLQNPERPLCTVSLIAAQWSIVSAMFTQTPRLLLVSQWLGPSQISFACVECTHDWFSHEFHHLCPSSHPHAAGMGHVQ